MPKKSARKAAKSVNTAAKKSRPKTAALPREIAHKKALLRKMGKAEE